MPFGEHAENFSDPKEKPAVGVSESPHSTGEKEEVKNWLKTLSHAQRWRDEKGAKAGWKRFLNEYRGNWDHLQAQTSIPIVPINLVYAYVKTEIARMSFRDPWITVNAKRVEDIGAAQIAEQIVNYLWGDLRLKAQIKLALLEALLVGHSWIKTGYTAQFGTVESQPKEEPRGPGRPPKKFKEVETSQYVKSEEAFCYYVPYTDIVFDPSASWPAEKNARWMAQKWVKPLRAVVQSGIYEHTDDLKETAGIEDPNSPYDPKSDLRETMKDVRAVTGWEIYDLDHQVITTVSPGCDYKLREIPLPDYMEGGFPFVQIAFNPVPGEAYPLSDVSPHEAQIVELVKLLSIELNHLKRWNRQLLVIEGCMAETEEEKFKNANDGAIVKVQAAGGKSLAENVIAAPYAPVQSDVYGAWNQIFEVWRAIAGQTAPDQGGQARTQTRTLGELRLQLQGGHARSDEKLDVLEDAIAEVARKLLKIIQKKFDQVKIARIVGPKSVRDKILRVLPNRPSAQSTIGNAPNPVASQSYATDFSFSWNRQDILGDMDVDVLAGSTTPLDREAQLAQLEKLLPFLSAVGIAPGSPAAMAFSREFMRLVGLLSLEEVMDLAEQSPVQLPPKLMETQAKIQARAAETQIKLRGEMARQQLKLAGMRQDLSAKAEKNRQEIGKSVIQSVLSQFRTPAQGGNGNAV